MMRKEILNPEEKLQQFFKNNRQIADPNFQKTLKQSLINDYYIEEKQNTYSKFLFNLKKIMNKKRVQKIAAATALSAVMVAGSYLWIIRENKMISPKDIVQSDENRTGFSPEIKINTGYAFSIPNEWNSRISLNTKDDFVGRFYPQEGNTESTYIELESGKITKEKQFIKSQAVETKTVNGWEVTTSSGVEDFKSSTRQFKSFKVNKPDNPTEYLSILAWNPNQKTEEDMSKILERFTSKEKKNALNLIGYSKVQAEAEEKVNSISVSQYKEIQVMGEPLKENIDVNGKYYKFQAFKGQRLTAVAFENEQDKGSYIKTELFSDNNRKLYDTDTRIEFKAPYTGTYYFKVGALEGKSGEALIKVFDRDQTEDLMYIKYANGNEKQYDPSAAELQIGESEVAIICEFANPIEIINPARLKYTRPSQEFEPIIKLETNVRVYGLKQSLDESNLDKNGVKTSTVTIPEQDENNLIPHKITKLSDKKILITKENGDLFERNYNYYFGVMSDPIPTEGGGHEVFGFNARFFTENKK